MFSTVDDIKQANQKNGYYWFEPATMRFFRSRVGKTVYGGCYFISSEQFDEQSPRLYTIRKVNADGSIEDASKFQEFSSRREAEQAIKALLSEDS